MDGYGDPGALPTHALRRWIDSPGIKANLLSAIHETGWASRTRLTGAPTSRRIFSADCVWFRDGLFATRRDAGGHAEARASRLRSSWEYRTLRQGLATPMP